MGTLAFLIRAIREIRGFSWLRLAVLGTYLVICGFNCIFKVHFLVPLDHTF
jgi:hypothetical protein